MTRANGCKPLTNIKRNSTSDPARGLDPTLINNNSNNTTTTTTTTNNNNNNNNNNNDNNGI